MEEITPQYIVDQSKIVDDQTLLIIIENYGEQERDKGSYANDPKFQ